MVKEIMDLLGGVLLRAAVLMLTAYIVLGVSIEGFWVAVKATVIISMVYKVMDSLIVMVIGKFWGRVLLEHRWLTLVSDLVIVIIGGLLFYLVGNIIEGVEIGNIFLATVTMLLYKKMEGVIERERVES